MPGITLAAGTAAQLVVDAPAFVALRGQNEKTARRQNLGLFVRMFRLDPGSHLVRVGIGVRGQRLQHFHLDVAAQLNIGAAPGHVGGDGHRAELAGIGNDLRFLLMLARVQDVMRNPFSPSASGQDLLRFLDRGGAHKHRLALFMGLLGLLDDRLVFFGRRAIDRVMFIDPRDGLVGRHFDHAQP